MRHPLLLPFLLFASCLSAQSISGNLNSGFAGAALGYGNVDIFRGEELVASVLTDRHGNFNVRLDTGLYRCVVRYDGFGTSTRMVRVKADEKLNIAMAEETGAPKGRPRTSESRVASMYAAESDAHMRSPDMPGAGRHGLSPNELPPPYGLRTEISASSGVLTAGEVNDFAKWTQWGDLSEKALASLRNTWGIAPGGRYTVDVQNSQGLPIADARVQLRKAGGGAVLFAARTDNSGKAELWASLAGPDTSGAHYNVEVSYAGKTHKLKAQPFEQSVNRFVLDVPCGQSNAVDVAFVVDATGSMQDEIDFLKAEMNDIIYRSKRIGDQLTFRFANVFYRDAGPTEEYTTRTMDFTRVLSTAVNFISAQSANGGGDTPEAVELALDSAINGLSWSGEARTRVIFLVLDAGPHLTQAVKQRMQQLIRQAAAKGIRIVPVAASGTDKATEYLMRTLAIGTNGTYTFLTDNSGVGRPHTAPSTDRYDVELLNDLLARILKSYTYMPDCRQAIPGLDLDYPDSLLTVPAPVLVDDTAAAAVGRKPEVHWSFFPNPTQGLVYITADAALPELYVTDLSGKVLVVLEGLQPGKQVEVDLGAFATGIYLVRCPVGDAWVSGKLVLQRY